MYVDLQDRKGGLPKQVCFFDQARSLLCNQPLKKRDIQFIQACGHLEELRLPHSQMSEKDVIELTGLCHLKVLDLSHNFRLSQRALKALTAFNRLQTLNLSDTPLKDESFDSLCQLTSLEHLNVSKCINVTKAPPHLSKLTLLESLNLSGCRLIGSNRIAHLSSLTQLITLRLNETPIDDDLSVLRELNITKLDLSLCPELTDKGMHQLSEMKKLKALNLSRCIQITDEGIKMLSLSQSLEWLIVYRCPNVPKSNVYHIGRYTTIEKSF
ncbi:MAG: hypothetical protein LW832_01180 [Parachlamydia sp.]|jgi:Leucine-rich repeat (LRR) protein|nr:hypothetical protein [Parachlamydia sp.]